MGRPAVLAALALTACSLGALDGFSGGEEEPAPSPPARDALDASPNDASESFEDADAASPTRAALYRDAVLADMPLAYFRFEETGGTIAKDERGAHDGTWLGTPSFGGDGVFAGTSAASFASGKLARLSIPGDVFRFAGNAPFTFEAWMRPGRFSNYQWIASTEAPRVGWSLLTSADASVQYEVWDLLADGGQSPVRYFVPTMGTLALSVYQHFVLGYDGTNAIVWLDGVRVKAAPWPKPAPAAGSLIVGCRNDGEGGVVSCLDDWLIDELAIYDHVLDDATVVEHYDLVKK